MTTEAQAAAPPQDPASEPARRVPWPVAAAFTAFLAVLIPVYWTFYGPTNFLYFCDVALFLTLISVWTHRALPASAAAVGILIPQAVWVVDFFVTLGGGRLLGMTDYMFQFRDSQELFLRGLSFFHFWLPFLLAYVVWKIGYDRRGLVVWTVLAWALMLVGYFLLPAPGDVPPDAPGADLIPVNVNYVFGPSTAEAQTWMPPLAWLATLLVGLPALVFVPTHVALRALCADAAPARPGQTPESVPEPL